MQAIFQAVLQIFAVLYFKQLLKPKPKVEGAKPRSLGDFQFPTATEGRSVPLLWGTNRVKGPNVVWYGDFKQVARKKKLKTGLFSSKRVVVGFKYYLGIQFALCRGPVDAIERIAIGQKEVFSGSVTDGGTITINEPNLFGGDDLGSGGITGTMKFFSGSTTQNPSTYLSQFQKAPPLVGDTPAYRGTCYLAPDQLAPYLGNSTSPKPWEFDLKRIPDGLSLGADALVNGADANLVNVMYELLTDTDWGFGDSPSSIDTASFIAAGATLKTENNGWSHILDSPISAKELKKLLEEQMDGLVFVSTLTGKWTIKLARADYDIDTVPEITPSNVKRIEGFTQGSWEETTNEVRVEFNDRDDEYKLTYAPAQDLANAQMQAGSRISATIKFPGCKNAALANQLAWRSLRTLSYPLSHVTLVVDRTFYAVQPGDVLAFTDPDLGFTKLPLRVLNVELGLLDKNEIRLTTVQDIFQFRNGSFNPPEETGWTEPQDDLQPFPAAQQLAFEAPRGFVLRDPDSEGYVDKVWAAARAQGPEVSFKIVERHAVGSPSGPYTEIGEVFEFILIGQLNSTLPAGSAFPLTSLTITPTPDAQAALESAFFDSVPASELGNELVNLIYVEAASGDGEFMLVTGAQTSGANVQLNSIYRGVLDSVQKAHASASKVYLIFIGGGMSDSTLPAGNNVDIKLLPRSSSDEVLDTAATAISFAMADRVRRPYAPSNLKLDNVLWASTTSLEANGAGPETFGIDLLINRRDYRTIDEVQALTVDASTIFSDYPGYNTTTHEVDVRNDPSGANTLLFTEPMTGAQKDILRLKILRFTDGVLPTTLRFAIRAKHTDITLLSSRNELVWDFSVTSGLTGQFNFAALDTAETSNLYTATAAGTYNFTLSSAFTAGDVEYRLNGGSWTVLIAAGGTTGSIAAVVSTDTIEVRHQSTDTAALKFLAMDAPGAGNDGYAVLYV